MTLKRLVFALIFCPFIAFAQPGPDIFHINWDSFENDIREKKNLEVNYKQLENIKKRELGQKDHIDYAHAWYYQLLITDARTEDSLYLRNSVFIDSILSAPGTPANLQLIMHVIQAKRLENFIKKVRRQGNRYYAASVINNYAAFTEPMLDSTVQFHYEQAKKLVPECGNDHWDKFTWLFAKSPVILFLPSLFDYIIADQIEFNAVRSRYHSYWNSLYAECLKRSPVDFIKALDNIKTNDRAEVVLKLYREWLEAHKNDANIYFYIESLAREYVYPLAQIDRLQNDPYEKYLQQGTESDYPLVRTYAVYKLCLLWYSRTKLNDLIAEKFPPTKILQLYEKYGLLFEGYTGLRNKLQEIKSKLLEVDISFRIAGNVLPNEPLLAKIEYKNAIALHYRIVPVSANEKKFRQEDSLIMYLLKKPGLRFVNENLPALFDLLTHKTLLKIDPLPAGRYCILFSPNAFNEYNKTVSMVTIQVTNIAIVPSDNRAYVLNRKSGLPLAGVKAAVTYDDNYKTTDYVVNRQGYVPIKKKEDYDVEVTINGDTLTEYGDVEENDLYGELFDKESDDLLDYYIDHASIHILTDRSIYRPGQTVYYKGILMTKEPKTGATIILNKKNLQHGPFRNFLKRWLKEEEPEMYITDPFNRKADTIIIKPNSYGAISGSFRIPKMAATGQWDFDGDIETSYSGTGEFSVEEYKRPTFELSVENQERTLLPGDPVTFKLKVRSFAGGPMANTKIAYAISRSVPYNMPEEMPEEMELNGVVQTQENGEAVIVVTDTALQRMHLPDSIKLDFDYSLTATATDITGESHDVSSSLRASTQPINITLNLNGKYFINDAGPIAVVAQNSEVVLEKEVKVKVFREKAPGGFVSRAFTNYADQWIFPVEQLAKWFPLLKFTENEEQGQELIYETIIKTGTDEKLRIPSALLIVGNYTIHASCYDNNKLLGKVERKISIYDTVSSLIPGGEASFFHLPVDQIQAGNNVRVFTGSAFDSTYLLLQVKYYSGKNKKLVIVPVFREQIIKAGIHSFTFHLPGDVKDQAIITSYFIRNNEVYRHSVPVWITEQSATPAIVIEQFRHKLTPAQQTKFSVSIKTKDHNVAAELMSTMYDASLDKLEGHNWEAPQLNTPGRLENNWPSHITSEVSARTLNNHFYMQAGKERVRIDNVNFSFQTGVDRISGEPDDTGTFRELQGSVMGLSYDTRKLNEVVVVGYGTRKKNYDKSDILSSLDEEPEVKQPVVKVRSNFNELAFFYPAVYADRDGYYRFTFTMPESLTEWNWKLFAHTKNAQFAYAERKLTTQLPFMIQPNIPKQLYQGDRLVLKTRISNLDSLRKTGKTVCKVEDAVTGEDLTAVVLKNKESNFDVAAQSNTMAGFTLHIPANQLNPIKITIKGIAGEYSDGEEHIIPVMTDKILVKQAIPFNLLNHPDTIISLPVLQEAYGLGVNIQPKPQSALINSLPFLANYSFDCAEQTFNKMLANVVALKIMRTDKEAQRVYTAARHAMESNNTPPLLPNQISEQAMPWLHLNTRTALQQKQLAELLDTVRTKTVIEKHLEKLFSLQKKDGGLCWFEKGYSDPYITAYILAGFGKLANDSMNTGFVKEKKTQEFINKMIGYIDGNHEYKTVFSAYARGYWKALYPVTEDVSARMQYIIKQQWKRVEKNSLYQQALLIIATTQWFDQKNAFYEKALQQLEHIRQQAIGDAVNGIRWKELADDDDLSISAEETLALLAEAFGKTPNATVVNDGIIKWLLSAKKDHEWQSTKAAAAAINILLKTQAPVTGRPGKINTNVNGKSMTVTDDLLSGQPYLFIKTNKIPEALTIKKADVQTVQGNIITYHFEPASKLSQFNTDIQLVKKLFRYNNDTKYSEPVGEGAILKVGEKLKVVLYIETARNLPYVYIDDKTGGAFETGDLRSSYLYESRISYYRSIRDGGIQFFSTLIPAGKTEITYELTVAQEGIFTNGYATLQCMYKPEKVAYSNSFLINTKE